MAVCSAELEGLCFVFRNEVLPCGGRLQRFTYRVFPALMGILMKSTRQIKPIERQICLAIRAIVTLSEDKNK